MEKSQKQLKCLTQGDGLVNYTMLPWYKGYVAMKKNGYAGYVETCGKGDYVYSVNSLWNHKALNCIHTMITIEWHPCKKRSKKNLCSFNKEILILNAYYIPGTILDSGTQQWIKESSCLPRIYIVIYNKYIGLLVISITEKNKSAED